MKRLFLLPVLLFAINASAQWTGATLDSLTHNTSRDEVGHQCVAIDKSNELHVVYSRENPGMGNNIFYRHRDLLSNWSAEDSVTGQLANNPVVAASNVSGEAYVAYDAVDTLDREIYACSNAGGTWNCTRVTSDNIDDFSPSIAVDSSGFIHLAWVSEVSAGNFKIKYATNLSGTMTIQTISISLLGQFGSGASPMIGVENDGLAHIVFRGDNGNGYHIHHVFNDAPGDSLWSLDYINTPNDEDLSSSIEVDDDGVVHVLVSGDDCFGCPVRCYYQKKQPNDTAFSGALDVAPGFVVSAGDLFVDDNKVPHVVLNEISGNIYTGNVIYADSLDWNGYVLLNTMDIYEANMVMDEEGHATLVAYRGNTLQDEEVIFFGIPNTVGINTVHKKDSPFKIFSEAGNLKISFSENFSGRLMVSTIDGKVVYDKTGSFQKNQTSDLKNLSKGIYIIGINNSNVAFNAKVNVN